MIDLPLKERSEYVRFLLTQLAGKYHVSINALSADMQIDHATIFRFLNWQSKKMSTKNLDIVESTVIDLYGPLLEDEVRLHKPFVQELQTRALARKK